MRTVKQAPAERFWPKVQKTEGCWLWQAQINNKGYGCFSLNSGLCYAHRFAWAITYGPIPQGVNVLHRCDTPACVRPDHLFLGTQLENIQDRDKKGRVRHGARHPYAKLTEEDIVAIRSDVRPQSQIAAAYGIGQMTVSDIKRGKTWKHVS